ncbi:MAG: peptide ABC transporter substrate-binding protein [Opitutaceae bacterium]|nr:peptide ABC transporter substrate-binding protein [Opitutaceae bacterium]
MKSSYPLSSALRPPSSAIRRPFPAFLLSSFVFGLCLLLLPACTKRETAVEAGIRTHTLLVGNGSEPNSLDPHVAKSTTDSGILTALFEGLTALDEQTTRAVPAVAERWEISPDGLVYTFHLRSSARWSNGDPVTAADFAFTFQRILNPKFGAHYSNMLHPIKNAEAFNTGKIRDFSAVGVAAIDEHTLRLTLERPTPYLPALATHMTWLPLHRPTLEKYRAVDTRTAPWTRPGALVGNGPFTLTEWRANVHIVVQKNPHYWDAVRNRLQRIVFLPTESTAVEERNFRAGQTHVTAGLPTTKIAFYREHEPARLRLDPSSTALFLRFNVTRAPFNNLKVRRALALAIDREGLVRAVFADSRRPAAHLTPPAFSGYTTRARTPTDFVAARRLLAEAGFPAGRGLPAVEILVLSSNPEMARLAEVIQETWRHELGVASMVATKEEGTFWQCQQLLDYSTAWGGWAPDFVDPATFLEMFVEKGGNNWTGWANPDYDRLISEAARTTDPNRRFEFFQQAEALLLEEAPIAPLYFDTRTYLIHPAVKGWVPAPLLARRYQYVWLEK